MAKRALAFMVVLGACGELKAATTDGGGEPTADGGIDGSDGGVPPAPKDAAPPPTREGGTPGPADACEAFALPCLDPDREDVIEVPAEMTLDAALAALKPQQVLQLRGGRIGAGITLPGETTLHGCEGATIDARVTASQGGGVVEGFTITGSLYMNAFGELIVRRNQFLAPAEGDSAAVVADAPVPTLGVNALDLRVERCVFRQRSKGIRTNSGGVSLPVVENLSLSVSSTVFDGVRSPIVSTRAVFGRPVVSIRIVSTTFAGFDTALDFDGLDTQTARIEGVLFASGNREIAGAPSWYTVTSSFRHAVPSDAGLPEGDPRFVNEALGDLRLGSGSPLVDRIPIGAGLPSVDLQGCARPAGPGFEPGAYESAP